MSTTEGSTPLPKWIIKFDDMESCCTSISDYKKLYEALSIAWEALDKQADTMDNHASDEQPAPGFYADEIREAMRQIEELGQ